MTTSSLSGGCPSGGRSLPTVGFDCVWEAPQAPRQDDMCPEFSPLDKGGQPAISLPGPCVTLQVSLVAKQQETQCLVGYYVGPKYCFYVLKIVVKCT